MSIGLDCLNPFRIRTSLSHANDPLFENYLLAAQALIDQTIPESFWLNIDENATEETIQYCLHRFEQLLPLVDFHTSTTGTNTNGIVRVLYPSEFTQGAKRYISDIFSRWLIPGKHLDSLGSLSIDFSFEICSEKRFFFFQEIFQLSHPNDLSMALESVPRLMAEIRMNILAVYHARYIASMKSLSHEQRNLIIQENISSLFLSSPSIDERNTYDQIHQFMLKMTEEEKIGQVKKNIAVLMHNHPQNFNRDIFYEMNSFPSYFSSHFASNRDAALISRVIAYHYLFKKSLHHAIQLSPNERHLSFKLFKSHMNTAHSTIGILTGINLLKETERFDKKHLLNAIHSCFPNALLANDSLIVDRRDEKIRIFYLEIQKKDQQRFSHAEVRLLQQELPVLLKRQVENVVHPIFMPRNEEEVLRNIVLLSKQIKFLRDIPHLTIHYEKQTDTELSFLIVLVRLLKEKDSPFKELLKNSQSSLRIAIDEIRTAGTLKRRYPKEAVIFRFILDKSPFFRKDYSLDLKRARQKVCAELRLILGEFRDYNGGMIRKQDEALEQFRKILGPSLSENELLLENYFYSIRPGIMQTVLPPETLKILFELLLKVLNEDFIHKKFNLKIASEGKYFFAMIAATSPSFKEEVQTAISKLKIASYDLTTTSLQVQEFATLGFIFRTDELERRSQFQQTLLETMLNWKANLDIPVVLSSFGRRAQREATFE